MNFRTPAAPVTNANDYPSYVPLRVGAVNWQRSPGAVDPVAATVRGGYYSPGQGPYAKAVDDRRNPGATTHPENTGPILAPRPRWGAAQGTGVAPAVNGGRGPAGVVAPMSYPLGRAGSVVEPAEGVGPGHVRSFTGGGGFTGTAGGVGGGSNKGGGPTPTTETIGTWSAGVAPLPTAPDDHWRAAGGVAGVVAPVGTGGPGTFPGGGTGDITTEPWAHTGRGEVDPRRLGESGNDDAGPKRELSAYTWFGSAVGVPAPEGIGTTDGLGSGVVFPIATRPTGRPGAGGGMMSAYTRPWDVELGSVPNNGAKVVIGTSSPAYGPGQTSVQHAATPIMVNRNHGDRMPGYSGGYGAPSGMSQTGYGRNSWRLTPQPWDVPVTDRG